MQDVKFSIMLLPLILVYVLTLNCWVSDKRTYYTITSFAPLGEDIYVTIRKTKEVEDVNLARCCVVNERVVETKFYHSHYVARCEIGAREFLTCRKVDMYIGK